jgi:NADH:ubiquinone oxidoreductase subunit 6 (subunit J)
VVQRYALDPQNEIEPGKVSVFGSHYNRNVVWFGGLILYGGANGFYAMSLLYGPLSLLAGCFTTLLIFNLIFARCMLGEQLSVLKVLGAVVILGGVIACIVASPRGVEVEFTPTDVEKLAARPIGAIYCVVLFGGVLASVATIIWYEKTYPLSPRVATEGGNNIQSESEVTSLSVPISSPPLWLDRVMSVLYPGSLGMDEGICHLTMKASVSMIDTCGGVNECGRPTMWVFMVVWVIGSVATLWWLRRVFTRSICNPTICFHFRHCC